MDLMWLVGRSFLEVLLVGTLLGAGVPSLFSLGLRLLARGDARFGGPQAAEHPELRVAAHLVFALVVGIILLGIGVVVASGLGL